MALFRHKVPMNFAALPYLTPEIAPIPGQLRANLEDFQVDEVLPYEPEGHGDHLWIRFEKRNRTTPDTVREIARALELDPRQSGFAGLKDKRAVTTQWASFFSQGSKTVADRARTITVPDARVLDVTAHPRKLKNGHTRGNRFQLRIAGVPPARHADFVAVLERLAREGVPNYFGAQRFGRDGQNAQRARDWLFSDGPAPRGRFEKKFLVSAFQSQLFNECLAERVRRNLFSAAVPGDLMKKEDSGGIFVAHDVDEANDRAARFLISPTGPMFGPRMRWPESDAAALERDILTGAGLSEQDLKRLGRLGEGTRRPLRVKLEELDIETGSAKDVVVRFLLPKGAFATAAMREVLKEDASLPEPGYTPASTHVSEFPRS